MHRTLFGPRLLLVALLPLVAACASLLEPGQEWRRVVGITSISPHQPPPIRLPDTIRAGVPFTATVITWGSGSCTRPDGAEVRTSGLLVEVTPYDREATSGVCTDDLRPYPREVSLRIDAAGEAVVRVIGRPILTTVPAVYEEQVLVHP